MTMFHEKKAVALLELLQYAHAEQYTGLDDEMPDDCDDWISSLSDDELSEIIINVYREGI